VKSFKKSNSTWYDSPASRNINNSQISLAGDQPIVAGQFIAHSILDADDDVAIPSFNWPK
jgi:hypothetical protein